MLELQQAGRSQMIDKTRRRYVAAVLGTPISAVFAQSTFSPKTMTPLQASKLADGAVTIVQKLTGRQLDFSPGSLEEIDRFVLQLRSEGNPVQSVQTFLLAIGCYVGEVFIRNLGMTWHQVTDAAIAETMPYIAVRSLSSTVVANPIGKVFKLFESGADESVWGLYLAVESRKVETLLAAPPAK